MDGVKEGFSDLGNAIRRILFGYDMNNPADKAAKENLERVAANDGKLDSGGITITNPDLATNGSSNMLLIAGVAIFLLFVFKD